MVKSSRSLEEPEIQTEKFHNYDIGGKSIWLGCCLLLNFCTHKLQPAKDTTWISVQTCHQYWIFQVSISDIFQMEKYTVIKSGKQDLWLKRICRLTYFFTIFCTASCQIYTRVVWFWSYLQAQITGIQRWIKRHVCFSWLGSSCSSWSLKKNAKIVW